MTIQQLTTIRSSLKGRLDTISGLNNHAEVPDAIPKAPFTVLGEVEIDYNFDQGGGMLYTFRLLLAVGERDSQPAWEALDEYLASTGDSSIKAVLEATSEAAPRAGDFTNVPRVENAGHIIYRTQTLVGAEFIVEVQTSS